MNKKQLIVSWIVGTLCTLLLIKGVFGWGWDTFGSLRKNIYCAMIPVTIVGGLLILNFSDKKILKINRKQLLVIWTMGITVSLSLLNILSSNTIKYMNEIKMTFWGIIVPIFIVGGLSIYTLRNNKK